MRLLYITSLILLVSIHVIAQNKEQKVSLSGYIKNLHDFSFVDQLDQLQWNTLLHNRLNFKYIPNDAFTLRLEMRNRVFFGKRVSDLTGFSESLSYDTGMMDLSWNIIVGSQSLFNTTIDRASVNYTKGDWDITLGRQRINWGVNLVWNPNDIFNTYNFLDFDYEERPGSDAVRIQYYTGDFNKVELAVKKGRGRDDVIAAAMYKFNTASYDIQLLTGKYQNDWVFGAGWAGNISNAGFKGEVSYFIPYKDYLNSKNVLSASVSADYGFKNGLYLHGSMLYISFVDDTNSGFSNLLETNLSAKTLIPFKYSGFLQVSKEFSPIISGSASVIYSPTRQSVIVIPSLKYSLAEDWELDVTGQSFFEFDPYQTLGNIVYFRLRWSF